MNRDKIRELNDSLKENLNYKKYGLYELSQKLDDYLLDDFSGHPIEFFSPSPSNISSVIQDVCNKLGYKYKDKNLFGTNGTIEVWVDDEIGDPIHFTIRKKDNM